MSLVACPECDRHIRTSEATCPFCQASVGQRLAGLAPRAMPTTRLGRAALFAFAAASVGTAACSSDADDGTGGDGLRDGGAEGDGGASNAGGSANAGGDDGVGGGVVALYGGAPVPTGGTPNQGAGGRNAGAGGDFAAPAYGAPFPPQDAAAPAKDAGTPDPPGADGGFVALYGGSPTPIYGAPPAKS